MSDKVECLTVMGNRQLLMYEGEAISIALSQGVGYEAPIAHMIGGYVREGDVCVDIGSNIGYFSLFLSTLLRGKGEIHSYEPNPKSFHLLNMNMEISKERIWKVYNKAVVDKIGVGNLVYNGDKCQTQFYSVETDGDIGSTSLDLEFIKCPNFIKIDTEGCEVLVLKGMITHLQSSANMAMMVEFCPSLLKKHNTTVEEFAGYLKMGRFRIYWVMPGGGWKFIDSPDSLSHIALGLSGETDLINLWCVR